MIKGKGAVLTAGMLALVAAGCAKSEKTVVNEANRKYVEAWMDVNYPGVTPTELGIYIIEDKPGTGETFDDQTYVNIDCTVRSLSGTISSTTEASVAQQLGTYEKADYYGAQYTATGEYSIAAGLEDLLKGMKVGGTRTAVIPSWLLTYYRYDKPSDYLKKSTDEDNAIYTVTLEGVTDDILKVQVDAMEEYADKYLDGVDSLSYGFYYKQVQAPTDTNAFPSDTTIYINYTARLLNRQVFDTTIKDTAKFYNIYSSSNTYEPVQITWDEDYTEIAMGDDSSSSSDLITGFQKTLWQMHKYEKGVGMFFSPYGYKSSGSGSKIPPYAPLVFEIEVVDEPED